MVILHILERYLAEYFDRKMRNLLFLIRYLSLLLLIWNCLVLFACFVVLTLYFFVFPHYLFNQISGMLLVCALWWFSPKPNQSPGRNLVWKSSFHKTFQVQFRFSKKVAKIWRNLQKVEGYMANIKATKSFCQIFVFFKIISIYSILLPLPYFLRQQCLN